MKLTISLKLGIVHCIYLVPRIVLGHGFWESLGMGIYLSLRITVCDGLTKYIVNQIYTQRTFLTLLVILAVLPAYFLLSMRIRACGCY